MKTKTTKIKRATDRALSRTAKTLLAKLAELTRHRTKLTYALIASVAALGLIAAVGTFASSGSQGPDVIVEETDEAEDPIPSKNLIVDEVTSEDLEDLQKSEEGGPELAAASYRRSLTQKAKRTAVSWWHRKPCGGKSVRVRWVKSNRKFTAYTYLYGRSPKGKPNCTIWVNKKYYPRPSRQYKRFCNTFVHEYGHLLGRNHSKNTNHIMYPSAGRKYKVGRCHL